MEVDYNIDDTDDAEGDRLASLEYTNLESEGITSLTRQLQVFHQKKRKLFRGINTKYLREGVKNKK